VNDQRPGGNQQMGNPPEDIQQTQDTQNQIQTNTTEEAK